MKVEEVQEIKDAILAVHGVDSKHVKSVPVVEEFEGKIAWQGNVEVFDLINHPKAKRAYGWMYRENNKNMATAVLEVPPVDSPQTAVKVAIASKARSR